MASRAQAYASHIDSLNIADCVRYQGQHFDFDHSAVRFHGGAEYVDLSIQTYTSSPGTGSQTLNRNRDATYSGFGPRIGVDALYGFDNGLSVYAKSAVGMYAGASRYHSKRIDANSVVSGRSVSVMMIVPELEAKLGGIYTYNLTQGNLSLDAGWMWINYFQSIASSAGGIVHSDDFGFQGPFLGLKWAGNIA